MKHNRGVKSQLGDRNVHKMGSGGQKYFKKAQTLQNVLKCGFLYQIHYQQRMLYCETAGQVI